MSICKKLDPDQSPDFYDRLCVCCGTWAMAMVGVWVVSFAFERVLSVIFSQSEPCSFVLGFARACSLDETQDSRINNYSGMQYASPRRDRHARNVCSHQFIFSSLSDGSTFLGFMTGRCSDSRQFGGRLKSKIEYAHRVLKYIKYVYFCTLNALT